MSHIEIEVNDVILLAKKMPILDVRSPAEYQHAHIPLAHNLPLFTDEERATVGTIYKQENREKAIKVGLDYFGPKMRNIVEVAESICENGKKEKSIIVHCWRGGMRSEAVAWLLGLYGFNVYVLKGGYKSFRKWSLDQFNNTLNIKILGGFTGSGKTLLLHEIEKQGELVIDLEGLASHKGSAFGNIGLPDQPTQEMFENLLALEIYTKSKHNKTIWLEDESQRIGAINIPGALYQKMLVSEVVFLEIPFETRHDFIMNGYGKLPKDKLIEATIRIRKRLGGLETKNAVDAINNGNINHAFSLLLKYYDKLYLKSIEKKSQGNDQVRYIKFDEVNPTINVIKLLAVTHQQT